MSAPARSPGRPLGVRAAALVPLAMVPLAAGVLFTTRVARIVYADSARSGDREAAALHAMAAASPATGKGALVTAVLLLVLLPFVASACWRPAAAGRRDAWRVLVVGGGALQAVLLSALLALGEDRFVRLSVSGHVPSLDTLVLFPASMVLAVFFVAVTAVALPLGWRTAPTRGQAAALLAIALAGMVGAAGLWEAVRERTIRLEAQVQEVRRRPPPPMPTAGDQRARMEERVRACEAGNADACVEAGRSMSDAERLDLYQRACDRGTAEVCGYLAMLHMNGVGTPVDEARAKGLLDRACRGGNRDSCGLFEKLKVR